MLNETFSVIFKHRVRSVLNKRIFFFRSSHEVGQLDRIDAIGKDLNKKLEDCLEETEYKSTLELLTELCEILFGNINSNAIREKVRALLKANPKIYNVNEKVKTKLNLLFIRPTLFENYSKCRI